MSKKSTIRAKVCEVMGMTCVLHKTKMKVYAGYVGIPAGHPLHGKGCDDPEMRRIDVHGGVSYAADRLPWWHPEGQWWIGFHCGWVTLGDAVPGMAEGEFRDERFAAGEVTRMARQLAGILVEMN